MKEYMNSLWGVSINFYPSLRKEKALIYSSRHYYPYLKNESFLPSIKLEFSKDETDLLGIIIGEYAIEESSNNSSER